MFEITDRVTVMRDGRRVFTRPTAETTQDDLVRAMVGEDLKARMADCQACGSPQEEALAHPRGE